jgi:multidrug resistance efflux pump
MPTTRCGRLVAGTGTLAVGGSLAVGIALLGGSGSSVAPASDRLLTADRGSILATVGGVGHVSASSATQSILVSSGSGAAGGGPATSPNSRAAAGSGSGASSSAGASHSGSGSAGATPAPADAIFPRTTGRVAEVMVHVGQRIGAGQTIARLEDDGSVRSATLQASNDLQSAHVELRQKRVSDPTRGLPPTASELAAGRAAVQAAQDKLRQLTRGPDPVEVGAARLEYDKALAELIGLHRTSGSATEAAQLAVETSRQKLAQAQAPANLVDVTAARLDLAKAQLELESLTAGSAPPTPTALAAGQLAVSLAQQKLAQLTAPPNPATVSTARQELAKAQAELAATEQLHSPEALVSARQAVRAAGRKLDLALHPPRERVSAARSDLQRARADMSVLHTRGGPASTTDIALAELKVQLAQQREQLATDLARRLDITAPNPGTVTSILTVPGATVDPTTPIVRAPDLGHLLVSVDLSEFDVAKTSVGNAASVSVDALGGQSVAGRVSDVAPSGVDNNGVVTFPVTVELRRTMPGLRPGMSASVRIVVASRRNVVRVPLEAVGDLKGEPKVTVVTGAGTKEQPVRLGLADAKYVEVISGLRPGDRVAAQQLAVENGEENSEESGHKP